MIFCNQCGKENTENANFCASCGHQLYDDRSAFKGNVSPSNEVRQNATRKSRKVMYIALPIVAVFAIIVTVLALVGSAGAVSDDDLYDEAINILDTEWAEPNGIQSSVQYSELEMTTIESIDGQGSAYKVSGNIFADDGTTASYEVKIHLNDHGQSQYEWQIDPQ